MKHGSLLPLDRCPHCGIAKPSLGNHWQGPTTDFSGNNARYWGVYVCNHCGGAVLAVSSHNTSQPAARFSVDSSWPSLSEVSSDVPERAREYLRQAIASLHAPAGATMLTASAVDAMLKEKGYRDGSLYKRIDQATADHLITQEMAEWAHEIRLEANDQRHADEQAALPVVQEAERVIDFANALAQFMFVLPARVISGRNQQA